MDYEILACKDCGSTCVVVEVVDFCGECRSYNVGMRNEDGIFEEDTQEYKEETVRFEKVEKERLIEGKKKIQDKINSSKYLIEPAIEEIKSLRDKVHDLNFSKPRFKGIYGGFELSQKIARQYVSSTTRMGKSIEKLTSGNLVEHEIVKEIDKSKDVLNRFEKYLKNKEYL